MKTDILLAMAAVAMFAPAAHAQSVVVAASPGATSDSTLAAEDQELEALLVGDQQLGDLRGGQAIIINDQTLIAVTSGNVLNGDYNAGDVSLSDNALSSFNGFGNLLINTGAQVSLQTGMSVIINVGQ